MAPDRFHYLMQQYQTNLLSQQEWDELRAAVKSDHQGSELEHFFSGKWKEGANEIWTPEMETVLWNKMVTARGELKNRASGKVIGLNRTWLRYAAAVILIAGVGGGLWWYTSGGPARLRSAAPSRAFADLPPGGDRAILTLADGSTIVLDSAANGNLASQGDMRIIKLNNGQLAYNLGGSPEGDHKEGTNSGESSRLAAAAYNTITTPRGGQYQVVLPDGSKVWLNAESSIKFPTSFTHNRKVIITGEVYFEIAPAKDQPFFVNMNETQLQVLGTSFNVNAYEDENGIKTTLVEGSVKVVQGNQEKKLQPGQQAFSQSAGAIQIKTTDVEQETAWKNGVFQFESADMKTIMRQLARWYDINVEYRGDVTQRFVATMPRDKPISKILEMLEMTGLVKFTITGKTILVEIIVE